MQVMQQSSSCFPRVFQKQIHMDISEITSHFIQLSSLGQCWVPSELLSELIGEVVGDEMWHSWMLFYFSILLIKDQLE